MSTYCTNILILALQPHELYTMALQMFIECNVSTFCKVEKTNMLACKPRLIFTCYFRQSPKLGRNNMLLVIHKCLQFVCFFVSLFFQSKFFYLDNKHLNHSLTQVSSEVYQVMSLSLQDVLLVEHSRTDIPVASKIASYFPLYSVNG